MEAIFVFAVCAMSRRKGANIGDIGAYSSVAASAANSLKIQKNENKSIR
jgi:ribosomal protein S16